MNFFRRTHAASPLQLHDPLTLGAQKWANKIVQAGKVSFDKTTTHNQTICVKLAQQDDAIRDCVVSWYAKIMNYDWAHKKINKDNRDFVVLINRQTTHVGIGIARGPLGKVYLVAFYSPKVDPKTLTENILPYTGEERLSKGERKQQNYEKGTDKFNVMKGEMKEKRIEEQEKQKMKEREICNVSSAVMNQIKKKLAHTSGELRKQSVAHYSVQSIRQSMQGSWT